MQKLPSGEHCIVSLSFQETCYLTNHSKLSLHTSTFFHTAVTFKSKFLEMAIIAGSILMQRTHHCTSIRCCNLHCPYVIHMWIFIKYLMLIIICIIDEPLIQKYSCEVVLNDKPWSTSCCIKSIRISFYDTNETSESVDVVKINKIASHVL